MSQKSINFKYVPTIIKINNTSKTSIFAKDPNIHFSSNIDYPRSEFGFHHFIHASKNKLEILKKFEGKKKVYLIHNNFEPQNETNSESIENTTQKKFSIDGVIDRNFYKLWEILSLFDIVSDDSSIISAHLGESTGGFVQGLYFYREEYAKKKSSNDKYHVESEMIKNAKIKPMSKIVENKTINEKNCDFVTSDVNINNVNLNIYEQLALEQILKQIIKACNLLKKGGTFVCKFYETFTMTSTKIITMLTELFTDVYFVKPLISEMMDSEKFAICTGFRGDKNMISAFNSIGTELATKQEKTHITDLFDTYQIPRSILISILELNIVMSNNQFKSINAIVNFIKQEIYFGEEFHDKTAEQLTCSKYWIQTFYSQMDLKELVNSLVKKSDESIKLIDGYLVENI